MNTSLLNPGPKNLKVYYQNVQGLIPFSGLGSAQPSLNRTKICELNYYVHSEKPDVILLNETWLKKSIRDHQVIEDTTYKIFRTDRSKLSHGGVPTTNSTLHKLHKSQKIGLFCAICARFLVNFGPFSDPKGQK